MTEVEVTRKFSKWAESQQVWFYKIPDPSKDAMTSQKRPFDAFLLHEGLFVAIEFKLIKVANVDSFNVNFNTLLRGREHQLEALSSVFNNGGQALFVVFVQSSKTNRLAGAVVRTAEQVKDKMLFEKVMCDIVVKGTTFSKGSLPLTIEGLLA